MLIACPSCRRQLNVPDNAAGKQVRCPAPDCGTIFAVSAQAPAPPMQAVAPRPVAAAPQPAAAPFDFGGGVAGPEADFGFTAHDDGGLKGIGMRTRLARGAGALNMAAGSMVLFALVGIGLMVARFIMMRERETAWALLVGAACMPLIVLPFPIAIAIGARMLSRARHWGLALSAAIMCLVLGVIALILLLMQGFFLVVSAIAAVAGAPDARIEVINTCVGTTVLAIVTGSSIYAGAAALRTLLNAEVKKTFT